MASITMELRLRVRYERIDGKCPTADECEQLLERCVSHLAGNGHLTGETDLVVDDYRTSVLFVGVD